MNIFFNCKISGMSFNGQFTDNKSFTVTQFYKKGTNVGHKLGSILQDITTNLNGVTYVILGGNDIFIQCHNRCLILLFVVIPIRDGL